MAIDWKITSGQTTRDLLPATLRLGPVQLKVSDLDRSVAWYQSALGLRVQRLEPPVAELGDGTSTVLVLSERAGARQAGRHAGLYHYALLYPAREELARAARRLSQTRTPIQGASDHGTHEAIYLPDPDGLGIELAADRARELWPTPEEEFSGGGPRPLDLEDLISTVADGPAPEHVAPGLRVGHIHLHVGSVGRGLEFYRDAIGFDVWAQIPSAAFVSAGGYHHQLAFNTWLGEGVGPMPGDAIGLRHWTIELDSENDVAAIRARLEAAGAMVEELERGIATADPWDIAVHILTRQSPGKRAAGTHEAPLDSPLPPE
jgi:catechol 2,3-dioxygenase